MAGDNLFSGWAIVELMGHVRLAGRVSEEEHFGAKLGRIDVPDGAGGFTTQFFGGGSVYRVTPTTEEIARKVAESSQPEPVYAWDLRRSLGLIPAPQPATAAEHAWEAISDEDDEEDNEGLDS